MGRYASDSGTEFQQAPTGTHLARCYQIIDIGTQVGEYQGQPTRRNQIIVAWELPHEIREDGKPFSVSKFYTNSLHEKAKLRHELEAWRGRVFTAEELRKFDLENILGKPCMVTVIANDKGKHVVSAVTAIPKGYACPDQINPSFTFWLDQWNESKFEGLSEGLKKLIIASEEYTAMLGGENLAPTGTDDDPIPF